MDNAEQCHDPMYSRRRRRPVTATYVVSICVMLSDLATAFKMIMPYRRFGAAREAGVRAVWRIGKVRLLATSVNLDVADEVRHDVSKDGRTGRKVVSSSIQELIKSLHESEDPLWELIRFEALMSSQQDEKIAGLVQQRVLSYDTMKEASRDNMATKLHTTYLPAPRLGRLMDDIYETEPAIVSHFREDLLAAVMRESGVPSLLAGFLFHKGYHAVATYRIAHVLYMTGRQSLGRFLQSVNSELFGADIHPACVVGKALYLSSASCVVIGETARLGDDVMILQGVTLGGNGKERGDRHPKIGSGVFVAAGATVLGNIPVGDGVIISAGSVVLRPLPEYTRASGVPAKAMGLLREQRAALKKRRQGVHYVAHNGICP